MNAKKLKAVLTALLITAAVFCAIPVSAEDVDSYTVSFPVKVSNPKKNIPEGTEFILSITGQPHAPLPDPSEIAAKVNGTYTFSPITFTEPGKYVYEVRQIAPEDKKLLPDTKVYEIVVTVIHGEDGKLEGGFTISNQAVMGKSTEIAFSNDYRRNSNTGTGNGSGSNDPDDPNAKSGDDANGADAASKKDNSPPTGEPVSPAFAGLFGSGAVLLVFYAVSRTRSKKASQGGSK